MRRHFLLALFVVVGSIPTALAQEAKGVAAGLQPLVEKHSLAGAVVLVADRDKVLALETVGYANIEKKQTMAADSLFWIASQTKPITAVGVLMLVDEGKLKLDDPVEKYLPEFKDIQLAGKKPTTTMTVRHLFTHTSGMPFSSPAEKPTLDTLSIKDACASYVKTPLLTEPGTKYLYSNAGINTLGRLIEVLSDMPYETFMDKRLFQPLGMKDTTFWPNEEQLKRLAQPYKPNAAKDNLEPTTIGALQYPLSNKKRQPMPAGGLFATAGDVAKFCQMCLNGGRVGNTRYLSEAMVQEMAKRQTPATINNSWGLGWSASPESYGHGGALATNMTIYPKRGLVTVYLVQHAGFPGEGGKGHGLFTQAALERFSKK